MPMGILGIPYDTFEYPGIRGILGCSIPHIPSYPPGQGMGYAKGHVSGYGVNKHTLHYSYSYIVYSFFLVFYECTLCTFHRTLGPGYGEHTHTLWRRVHTFIPGYILGYGTSKEQGGIPRMPLNKYLSQKAIIVEFEYYILFLLRILLLNTFTKFGNIKQ